jgi:signal transduction histidine kinase
MLVFSFICLASVLRRLTKFDATRARLANVVALLVFAATGAFLAAIAYCGTLNLTGAIVGRQFYGSLRQFWLGDTLGLITVIPAATALFSFLSQRQWRFSNYTWMTVLVCAFGTLLIFAILLSGIDAKQNHSYYLLFLPIIWVATRGGYAEAALALPLIQVGLVALTTYLGLNTEDFSASQMLMLVLSTTGLLIGAVVTERDQATRLQREQQAELARLSAYATAGAMGVILVHEISQPLSTVVTYLHAARRMLRSGAPNAPVMDALVKAEQEATRTREVLGGVRDFVSNRGMELELLDLAHLCLKIASLCREDATARGVLIDVEIIRPIPLVKADRVQIELALNNLVINAIDAASEREEGRGQVVVRVVLHPGRVVVQIDDNGPGVAAEIVDRLFDAYQTTKPRGMGLGLPLTLQIVQKHAGRLWWEQIVPRGTRFVVELQIHGPDQNAA